MKVQKQVKHAVFIRYLACVREQFNVIELPSIHRGEFDTTYQIYKEG